MLLRSYKYFRNLYFAIFLIAGVLLVGTMGYMAIEGYSFIEAFYMTIITVSTVGFGEVAPLSDYGRLFTAILIITSFGIFAYGITSITRYLVTGELRTYLNDYKVNTTLDNLSNHVIVCGFGRNGMQATRTLRAYRERIVVIENDEDRIQEIRANGLLHVNGDAKSEETLILAGIKRAKSMITTLPDDADNVFVVLTSRELNKDLIIISRASQDRTEKKLRIAGANNVIMPDKVGGAHMASLVVTPDVHEFLDHISIIGSNEVNLEEINFVHLPEEFHNKPLGELNKSYNTGCMIIGYKSPEGEFFVNPDPLLPLIPDCKLFVLGSADQIKMLNELFNLVVK